MSNLDDFLNEIEDILDPQPKITEKDKKVFNIQKSNISPQKVIIINI